MTYSANSFVYSSDEPEMLLIYHAHTFLEKPSGNRAIYIDRVKIVNDKLAVDVAKKRPQPVPLGSK